jgi:UDP-N-acetylglucosamine acyltransferase
MNQPLANIHPEAKIEKDVIIEPFATVSKDVIIGEGSYIGPNATILPGTRIGKNCKIFPCAVIGGDPQDLKFKGEYSTVEIGDNTTIREYVTINKGTAAKGKTVIGNNCLIMAYVHVAHDCFISNNVILVSYSALAGEVIIDDYAILGGRSAVHQFCHVGKHVMLAGGSLVRKDVPPYIKAGREPLSYAGVNSIGLRRRDFSNEVISQIQDIYRIIYQKGFNNTQALEVIEAEMSASKERDEILLFLKDSKRGIIKGYFPD